MNDMKKFAIDDKFINQFQIGKYNRLKLELLYKRWTDIVGKTIGQYSKVKTFNDGILIVIANNSPAMHAIHVNSPQIIERFNQLYGENIVKKIRCYSGQLKDKNKEVFVPIGMRREDKNHEDLIDFLEERTNSYNPYKKSNKEYIPFDNILLTKEVVDEIDSFVAHIENPELKDIMRKVGFGIRKKRFYLEQQGYKKCPYCDEFIESYEKVCFLCLWKQYRKKIGRLKAILKREPHLNFEEIQKYELCTINEMSTARRECIGEAIEAIKTDNPPLELRYQVIMLLKRKKKRQLSDDYVIRLTEKYLPKNWDNRI